MNPGLLTAFVAIPFNLRVPRPSLSSVCVNYNLRPVLLRSPAGFVRITFEIMECANYVFTSFSLRNDFVFNLL